MQNVTIYLKTDPPTTAVVQMERTQVDQLMKDWLSQYVVSTEGRVRHGAYEAKNDYGPVTVMIRFADVLAII